MNSPAQEFPTYPEWLASHSDEAIADLLWRLYAHGSTSLLEQLSGTAHPEPALHHLTALELAILHAATEIGAANSPVSVEDLDETLTELFDIAGTTQDHRPTDRDIHAALRSLAGWGLLFGPSFPLNDPAEITPSTQFKVPAHIPPLFEPSTEHLWRLADCNRCPIPTADLPTEVDQLPPRQRRLLGTLSAAGGVGHSATLKPDADPDAPLPTMVRHGILDQLDDTTARLSGRVGAYLRRTLIGPVGGTFRSTSSTSDATTASTATDKGDTAAIAVVVQKIQELSEAIDDLGANPLQPLGAGGVGSREINKLTRRRDITADKALELINQLHLANFLAREFPEPSPAGDSGRTYWAITEAALDFAEAPLSTQWAMLLLGWAGSTYATWMLRDGDVRPLSPETLDDSAAELRSLFCQLFATSQQASDPTSELWRLRPALAWETPQLAWDSLLAEATALGLLAPAGRSSTSDAPLATSALTALKDVLEQMESAIARGEPMPHRDALSALSLSLASILPDPVRMLIIQGDHTIMAPGLLAADDQNQLARIAEQESSGMASVWRVSKQSLLSAFDKGDSPEQIEAFLDRMSPGGLSAVPQSLRYLVTDAHRAYVGGDATGTGELSARRGAGVPCRVPTPARTLNDPSLDSAGDIAQQIDGAVEGFRRAHSQSESYDPNDGTSATDTRTVRAPREVMTELRTAYSAGTQVRLHYVDYAGATSQEWISIVMMTPSTISAVIEATGETITVQPHRIAAVDVPR